MATEIKHVGLTQDEFELLFDAARLASPSRTVAIKAARALLIYEDQPHSNNTQYVGLERREAEMILDYFRLASPARALALKMVHLVGEWEAEENQLLASEALRSAEGLFAMGRAAQILPEHHSPSGQSMHPLGGDASEAAS